MAFDFVTQMQGPKVDTSLFGDAATQGIAAGSNLPTTTTSIIKGGLEGLQTGINIYDASQKLVLQQNKIEQLPVENERAADEARTAKAAAELNELNAEKERLTQQQDILATEAKLKADVAKANNDVYLLQKQSTFNEAYQKGTPQDKANLVLGGQFNDLFAANPNLYKQSVQGLLATPGALTQEQARALSLSLGRSSALDYYAKDAFKKRGIFEDAKEKALGDTLTDTIASQHPNMLPEEILQTALFKPTGQFVLNDDNTHVMTGPDGKWLIDPEFNAKDAQNTFTVLDKQGNVLATQASAASKAIYDSYNKNLNLQNGTYGNIAADKVTKQQLSPPEKTFDNAAPTPETPKAQYTGDPLKDSAKQFFGVSDASISKIETPLKELQGYAQRYALNPAYASSPEGRLTKDKAVETISRAISDEEFDASPSLQNQYTEEKVKEYNRSLHSGVNAFGGITLSNPFGINAFGVPTFKDVKALEVSDPKDLYYKDYGAASTAKVNALLFNLQKNAKAKATRPMRKSNEKSNVTGFLSSVGP